MTSNYYAKGLDAMKQGDFVAAGDFYTQSSYSRLSHNAIRDDNDRQVGGGLHSLLRAAINYRRGDHMERCRNRCEQGLLISRDLEQNVISDSKRLAVLQEFIADFHAVGGIDGMDEAYQEALKRLDDADLEYTISFHSSNLSDNIISFTLFLFQWAEENVEEHLETQYDFAGRVEYKRTHMDEILYYLESDS